MYPNWVLSGTHDSGFSLGLMARDAALAVDVAAQIGESPALLAAVAGQWQDALAVLGPRADFTEIARTVAPAITPRRRPRTPIPATDRRRLSLQPTRNTILSITTAPTIVLRSHRPGSPGRRLPGRSRRLR